MIDYAELKRLAEAALNDKGDYVALNDYGMAVPPAVVLELIAENEQLGRYLCTCRDCGGEGSLHTGDWHSYSPMEPPEPVMEKCGECDGTGLLGEIQDLYQLITDRDQLKAENEAMREEAELYRQVQIAAGSLPSGWEIALRVENGYGGVDLIDPYGTVIDLDNVDESLGESVASAVAFAMSKEG